MPDLMLILLYRSNTTCSTCVVSSPFQILATTVVVKADTYAWGPGQDIVYSKAQPSTRVMTGGSAYCSSLRICSLFFNADLLVVRMSPLSANRAVGCGANSYEIRLSVDMISLKDAMIPMTHACMNSVFIF